MQLSEHFQLAEFVRSQYAARHGLDNTPPPLVVESLRALCLHVLEPLRAQFGPIQITSGYRSPRLNRAIGGAANSQHLTGEAADLIVSGVSVGALFDWVRASSLPYDQVIDEFSAWLHVSYAPTRARRQALQARRTKRETEYLSV